MRRVKGGAGKPQAHYDDDDDSVKRIFQDFVSYIFRKYISCVLKVHSREHTGE